MSFGGYSINKICFDHIRKILPDGKTILELGSGYTTGELSKYYTVYSIENDIEWIHKYNSTYIYAPIKFYDDDFVAPNIINQKGWYDPNIVKGSLPKKYDLILVDGPNGVWFGRGGFYKYLNWFSIEVPIIFDDINREPERILMKKVSNVVGRKYKILDDGISGIV